MTVSRHVLFGKLDNTLFRAIESATAFCKLRGNPYVELAHWINQIHPLPDSDWQRIIRHFEIDAAALDRDIAGALAALPAGAGSISDFSHHIENAIERAWLIATLSAGDFRVRGAWLVAALVETPELRRVLLGISPSLAKIPSQGIVDLLSPIIQGSPESRENARSAGDLPASVPGEASQAMPASASEKSPLALYCSDLTERARNGEIDPVIGREHEIRTLIDILLRRRQNNPLLTGEAGVGKTAIVEGLALAIAHGRVPPSLQNARLLGLDVGALLAGASMKGEFESRLKGTLEDAARSPHPVILFVDEIHTLVGAGGQAGTGDAANLLKPALARGTLRTVGATTWGEYKRHIEKDPALTRRFQVLQILEPEEDAAIDMVRGLTGTFAAHHGVWIMDDAVRAAVTLSHRFIPSRQLPDKAISLLDTACARVALSLHTPPARIEHLRERLAALRVEYDLLEREAKIGKTETARLEPLAVRIREMEASLEEQESLWEKERERVERVIERRNALIRETEAPEAGPDTGEKTDVPARREELRILEAELEALQKGSPLILPQVDETVVAAIVSDWTGIPVGRMMRDEVSAVLGLPGLLGRRIIGQDHALRRIAERIQVSRARLADPGKPIGVFLLVGPSGVGKTETALTLAEALYGGEQNLIAVNMSEFQEAHTVSTLKGAPPGYVGYGEGGVLTEAVRRRPYSVILLDEIEKAHRDVHEVFYQVFDKGWMEDGEGRYIDFRNTVILLTSNVGSELISGFCDDPELVPDQEALTQALQPELRKVFPATFMGRLTLVPYFPLTAGVLNQIVRLHLDKLVERMRAQHDIMLEADDAVVGHVVARCGTHETGARLLVRFIEQQILPQLSSYWLTALSEKKSIRRISIGLEDEKLIYRVDHPDAS
ncbi:MAG: type VI secretion system ATPase TssH [Candidatus Accumulibacter sp.]|jgi:type VI secretion system protein VasG|nr:type VI secretion system ATPase TssH [Accumulibacter sp.]